MVAPPKINVYIVLSPYAKARRSPPGMLFIAFSHVPGSLVKLSNALESFPATFNAMPCTWSVYSFPGRPSFRTYRDLAGQKEPGGNVKTRNGSVC